MIPRIAAIIAFFLGSTTVFSAVSGAVAVLPFALIPIMSGIGILRKRAWSAYGLACYLAAQVLLVAILAIRDRAMPGPPLEIAIGAGVMILLSLLFLSAGSALERMRTPQGSPGPWIAVSALSVVPLVFIQPFALPTTSMENTILSGEQVLVLRYPTPRVSRGNLIAFNYPPDPNQKSIKRIIGIGGDRIRIHNKVVYRNGAALVEPYAANRTPYVDPYRDNFPNAGEPRRFGEHADDMLENHVVNGEVVVPQGSYFVLGDNRDMSLDSRYWGFVRDSDVFGRPILIYGSEERAEDEALKRDALRIHRVRWGRLFRPL